MGLAAGDKVGAYEILSALGAGAMGEVYRANDPRLKREVAIKLLPAALREDASRLRRFEQEARAVAALSHSNVLAIYDVGEHEGAPFIVTELLEGQTLRERLDHGALPIAKALDHAAQIARGLGAAHDKGIVHRDLKPANVLVTRDGRVKILDFGLAKMRRADGDAPRATDSTLSGATASGVVLGSVGYMAPEQVRGQEADERSDIFALGVMLREMLTGERVFAGDSAVEIGCATLNHDPPDLAEKAGVPAQLARVVQRCLAKPAEERFQSARDLAFALEALAGGSSANAAPARFSARRTSWRWAGLGVLGLGLLGAGVGIGVATSPRAADSAVPSYTRLTFRRGFLSGARFGPDGKTVVYSATWSADPGRIFSTRPDRPESRALGVDARLLAVSRSGEMAVALESPDDPSVSTLARVPLEGGTPRPVLEHVPWADWDAAGAELAIVHTVEGKDRLEYPIGKVLYETAGMIQGVRISPKGDLVAFGDCPARYAASCAIAVVDRAGSKRALTHTWWYAEAPAWAAAGDEIWFTGGEARTRALYAVSLSGRERIVSNVPGRFTLHDIAADGRALLEAYDYPHRMMVRPRGQEAEQDFTWFDYPLVQDISDDGQTILFAEAGMAATSLGADDVTYLRRTDGSPAIELGPGLGSDLSPDGKWVVAVRKVDQPEAQIALLPMGAGEPVLLERDEVRPTYAQWFPDGKRILVQGTEVGAVPRLYVRDIAGGSSRPLTPEGVSISSFVISPEGTEIVAQSADRPVMSYPVGGGEPVPVLELAETDNPIRFSKDGRWLYFSKATNRPVLQIYRLDVQTRDVEPWLEIRPPDPAGFRFFGNIALTPDGMAYAYDYHQNFSHLYVAEGLR